MLRLMMAMAVSCHRRGGNRNRRHGGRHKHMGKSVGDIIRKTVTPVMEKNDFSNTFSAAGQWEYEKATKDGERRQVICIGLLEGWHKYVKLEVRILPSKTYFDIPMDKIIVGDEGFKKELLGGWAYETVDDVEKILLMIVKAMEKKGFSYMDIAEADPEDVFPKRAEERLVMKYHEDYAMEFLKEHHLTGWDIPTVADAIMQEIARIPYVPGEEDRKKIMRLASAYGELLVSQGASWEWDDEIKVTHVVFPCNPRIGSMVLDRYPLRRMYYYVFRDNRELPKEHLLNDTLSLLEDTGRV